MGRLIVTATVSVAAVVATSSPATANARITIEQVVTDSQNSVSSIESPSFTTSGTDPKVLVAYVAADGPSGARQSIWGINGCGLSWLGSGGETPDHVANDQAGIVTAYYAVSYKPLTDCVVKARLGTGGYAASITVTVLSGARPKVAFSKASGADGAAQATAQASSGSLVFGVATTGTGPCRERCCPSSPSSVRR
ncbi:hypothetical protein [Nonomuraea recticatena]